MMLKVLYTFTLIFSLACSVPVQQIDNVDDSVNDSSDSTNNNNQSIQNYFQLSSTTSQTTLSFESSYSDSFLIRGSQIHTYLSENSSSTLSLCLVTKFDSIAPNKILLATARARSNFNYALGITEYYLQVEPNNSTTSNIDCNSINLTTSIQSLFGNSTIERDSQSICPSCTSPLLSQEIKLISNSGDIITDITTTNMRLNLLVSNSTNDGGNGGQNFCSEDSSCTTEGFDCCLQGQCVNHAAVKAGVDTSDPNYINAVAQVTSDPSQVVNYPNFFYICPNLVNNDNNDNNDNSNPTADEQFTQLQELYNCTNPIEDEFAICTKTFEDANQSIQDNGGSYLFSIEKSDITFRNLNASLNVNNIKEITYGTVPMFKDSELALNASFGTMSAHNDDISSEQSVTLTTLPTGNSNNKLKIHYRVDASCEKLNDSLAQCKKKYIQGQVSTPAKTTDHVTSQVFLIPSYANTAYNLLVKVGGITVPQSTNTWSLSGHAITFNPTTYPVYINQEVEITYFITNNIAELTTATQNAKDQINTLCSCVGDASCYLAPVYQNPQDTSSEIINYSCQVEQSDTVEPPLQKTFYLSSKSVAHKFFDTSGAYYKYNELGSHKQECGHSFNNETNCTSFKYTNNNENKPNNVNQYIGFTEIYGTFNQGSSPAIPATEIDVVKGRVYDIFTNNGVFSTCESCGSDYYSNIIKLFPNNFTYKGGGYLPNMVESRRQDNQSNYNADDMKFGRACFVPATMIPWTHTPNADINTQRRKRLAAQHFMFANGYNKDWYGFDYGSLIGSFDGVTWFSIGNERNIQAKSNKLYVAINAYYGDQTEVNSYQVTISEIVPVLNSGSSVNHDSLSDGAQCQLAHYCQTDNDCVANLGYDYACEDVNAHKTPWPRFDDNGNEVSGQDIVSIASLVGGTNGQVKRCVYRGRGSLCTPNPSSMVEADSYTGSVKKGLNMCSNNTFCSPLSSSNFNNKISRFAKSLTSQNTQTFITDKTDLFGMAARVLGRPYDFYGTEAANSMALSQLSTNGAQGMCVPGKAALFANTVDQLNSLDPVTNSADSNFEIGQTITGLGQSPNYFAACPATNDDGNFTYKTIATPGTETFLSDAHHKKYAIAQNMSTNSFDLSSLINANIYNDQSTIKSTRGYDKNSCVRAPGASCFTDLDCSVNSWVSNKFKSVSDFSGEINQAEIDFWKEDLVCATAQERYPAGQASPNESYDSKGKKCCREIDKSFTFYTQKESGSDFKVLGNDGNPAIPGVNIDLNDPERYSRIHTIYDLLDTVTNTYPLLITPNENATAAATISNTSDSKYQNQYKTLHAHNERMCCTGHWVREFANGGHQFNGSTGQDFSGSSTIKNIFRDLNWLPNTDPANTQPFFCTLENADTAFCELRYITEGSAYEQKWLNYFSKFELTGIPQIFIESHLHENDYKASLDINQDAYAPGSDHPVGASGTNVHGIMTDESAPEDFNVTGFPNRKYFSAASVGTSSSKYSSSMIKKVFSEKDFACCMPTGIQVADTVSNSKCCTGQVTDQNGPRRCCLNDYADLSVYTNRYVSSEGAQFNGLPISDGDIDPATGYIRKELVKQMGATMCCSGKAEYGVAISELYIPLIGDTINQNLKKRRFIDNDGMDNATGVNGAYTHFARGQKWNNHVYCVPSNP